MSWRSSSRCLPSSLPCRRRAQPCRRASYWRRPRAVPAAMESRVPVFGFSVVARQFLGWSPFASLVAVVRVTLHYHVEHWCRLCDKRVRTSHPQLFLPTRVYCGCLARIPPVCCGLQVETGSERQLCACCGAVLWCRREVE